MVLGGGIIWASVGGWQPVVGGKETGLKRIKTMIGNVKPRSCRGRGFPSKALLQLRPVSEIGHSLPGFTELYFGLETSYVKG